MFFILDLEKNHNQTMHLNSQINLLTLIGLLFDIGGALLIFIYPLSEGNAIIYTAPKIPEKVSNRRARIGFCILAFGFIFQFLGGIWHINL